MNGTCMLWSMEKLYCAHCDKTYSVKREAIRLMEERGKKIEKVAGTYRFEGGCFFKELVLIRRETPPAETGPNLTIL